MAASSRAAMAAAVKRALVIRLCAFAVILGLVLAGFLLRQPILVFIGFGAMVATWVWSFISSRRGVGPNWFVAPIPRTRSFIATIVVIAGMVAATIVAGAAIWGPLGISMIVAAGVVGAPGVIGLWLRSRKAETSSISSRPRARGDL